MKKISILGTTGSIGTQAIEVLKNNRDQFKLVSLSAGRNIEKLREILKTVTPELVSVMETETERPSSPNFLRLHLSADRAGSMQLQVMTAICCLRLLWEVSAWDRL